MAGNRPRICVSLTDENLKAVKEVEPLVDLIEVRLDLIGSRWKELIQYLEKPWIACNRIAREGGRWQGSEPKRIEELLSAVVMGAKIVDIELITPGIEEVVREFKGQVDCLISHHDLKETPPLEELREIVRQQLAAGADICKLVTTARRFTDNMAALQLITDFPETRMVSFAMGTLGYTSRIFCPLGGGDFTYASIEEGREAAPGQIAVRDLRKIYGMLEDEK